MRRLLPVIAILSAACTPNNAQITDGHVWTFLAASTFTAPFRDAEGVEGVDTYAIDCRDLDEGQAHLPDAMDICNDPAWPPTNEGWLDFDGYYALSTALEPWRGEAIITSEGDLQLGFHQKLFGGNDLRFAFVVDPNFQPKRCNEDGAGGVELMDVDGNWLDNWSGDADNGTLFYLNAGGYQFNPSNTEDLWILPEEWRAGYAAGKYEGAEFELRSVRFGEPAAYALYEIDDYEPPAAEDLFYAACPAMEDVSQCSAWEGLVTKVEGIADDTKTELELVGVDFRPNVHTNAWRPTDGQSAGLDSWVELHYNWVRFDSSSTLEVGGSASGDFALTLDAGTTGRAFITGSFEIDRIKRDHWVTDDIEAIKLEENGTILCGE